MRRLISISFHRDGNQQNTAGWRLARVGVDRSRFNWIWGDGAQLFAAFRKNQFFLMAHYIVYRRVMLFFENLVGFDLEG